MRYLETLRNEVKRNIQDEDEFLNSADLDSAISRAARILSLKSPFIYWQEFTGDGSTEEWALSTTYWIGGFSAIVMVYYPWDMTDTPTPPPPLESSAYAVYEKTLGVYWFRMNAITPSSSETVRIYYNANHSITETASTLRDAGQEDTVILLASGFCLDMMATRVIAQSNSNIASDSVSYQSRSSQYSAMAKIYKQQSGLSGYLGEQQPKGGGKFASLGRKSLVSDSLT